MGVLRIDGATEKLIQHGPLPVLGRVCLQVKGSGEVWCCQVDASQKSISNALISFLLFLSPSEHGLLPTQQVSEGTGDDCVILDIFSGHDK